MARTTLNLDASVMRELRERSRREQTSIGALASQLLAQALKQAPGRAEPEFKWASQNLGEPAVDLEDKEALRALLDQPE